MVKSLALFPDAGPLLRLRLPGYHLVRQVKNLRFRVATYLVSLLCILALIRINCEGFIPALPPNALEHKPGSYLQAGVHQPVKWQGFGPDVVREARKQAKPTLLVIGAPWSMAARLFDTQIFSNLEIANLINQNFVPIRIDAAQDPRWLSCLLPQSRLNSPLDPSFQIYVLDTRGRLLARIDTAVTDLRVDPNPIHDELLAARDAFADDELNNRPSDLAGEQQADLDLLRRPATAALPDFGAFDTFLGAEADPVFGGFKELLLDRPNPYAWEYLLRTGKGDLLRKTLDPFLCSPAADAVSGGFYRRALGSSRGLFSFDQIVVRNAEMTELLAEAGVLLDSEAYRNVASLNESDLLTYTRINQSFAACRATADPHGPGEGPVTQDIVESALTPAQAAWAERNLGLDSPQNPAMIPHLSTISTATDPNFMRIAQRLNFALPHKEILQASGLLDVTAKTVACLLRTARILGDEESTRKLLMIDQALGAFRFGDRVRHTVAISQPGTYLGDYLAFADAQLACYESGGDADGLRTGLAVLERAQLMFGTTASGIYQVESPADAGDLPAIAAPDLTDDLHESCSGQMIRLLFDYGRLFGNTKVGQTMVQHASESVARFVNPQIPFSCRMASFYCASASFADPQCAFAVGPDAQKLANSLFRLRPNRLVVVAKEAIRPDIAARRPGLYVVNGSVAAGPYTVEEAAKLIPARNAVALGP